MIIIISYPVLIGNPREGTINPKKKVQKTGDTICTSMIILTQYQKNPETQKASNRRMKLKVEQFDGVFSDIKIITGTVWSH